MVDAKSGGAPHVSSHGAPRVLSPARYLAWLYSTPEQQVVLGALCNIESEIAGSLRPGIDHHVAHTRLQWWQEECARAAQGKPVHPLTRQLLAASPGIAVTGLAGFVDTATWDLASATFETRTELSAYCERWAAAMFETSAAPGPAWRALGAAVREIELLSDLGREAHGGRLRVPLDELDRIKVDAQTLAQTPLPEALVGLLRERYGALRASLAESTALVDSTEQPRLRGLLVWAALAWKRSLRAERALPHAIQPRRSHALGDGWQAWRAARRASAKHFRLR